MNAKIKIPDTLYIHAWASKEYGSYEDQNCSDSHSHAILINNIGKVATLNKDQCNTLIVSGEYHCSAWDEDDIEGGKRTMRSIKQFVEKLKRIAF